MKYLLLLIVFVALSLAANSDKQSKYLKRTGEKWLAEKSTQPGVVTLESGLRYKVLKAGTGKKHPGPTDQVEVHYAGTLKDGSEFDSSIGRGSPATFGVNQVIRGWTEALQLMVEGDEWYEPFLIPTGRSTSPTTWPTEKPALLRAFPVLLPCNLRCGF